MKYEILQGDNRDTLKTIPDNSIDAIITDPPYGIDFLGKSWDANTGALDTYRECLRVLKPGGHILAFSAARTYHHLAVTLEQAGFEIRDQIMWIYSSGFPKSQDVGKSIDRAAGKKDPNYGTDKASVVTTAEHRTESTYVRCKICNKGLNGNTAKDCDKDPCGLKYNYQTEEGKTWSGWGTALKPAHEPIALARKPMKQTVAKNVQTWGTGAINIDATRISYDGPTDKPVPHGGKARQHKDNPGWMSTTGHKIIENPEINEIGRFPSNVIGSIPDYQKYFYCPKVSRKERHMGFPEDNTGNNHPTVKPIELMKYLIKLITPAGGTVLDPFNGSGSTGCAAVELGHPYIGCELDPAYVEISRKRIEAWIRQDPITASGLFE
jgi:site-specific DNA-methyltransferase (adenine-specific)